MEKHCVGYISWDHKNRSIEESKTYPDWYLVLKLSFRVINFPAILGLVIHLSILGLEESQINGEGVVVQYDVCRLERVSVIVLEYFALTSILRLLPTSDDNL